MVTTHLDMVSGPCWKHSRTSRVTAPVRHRYKNMASCSSFVTCFESSSPAYTRSSCKSFQNTCFDIPMVSWNRTGWPLRSSWSQACPERAELYIGLLIKCGIIWCPTTALPAMVATRTAVLNLCRCWARTDTWRDLVIVVAARTMDVTYVTVTCHPLWQLLTQSGQLLGLPTPGMGLTTTVAERALTVHDHIFLILRYRSGAEHRSPAPLFYI